MSTLPDLSFREGEPGPLGSSSLIEQPCSRFKKGGDYIAMRERIHRQHFAVLTVRANEPRSRKVRYRALGDPTIYRADTRIENGVELFVHNDGTVVFSSALFAEVRKLK